MKTVLRYPASLYVFLMLAGLSGAGLVIAAVSLYGPGLTHDSTAYIFAAKSLLKGSGLEYFGYPSPFIQWPPLYPILLAAAQVLGIGHPEASAAINAIAHGLIIIITGYWLYSRLKCKLCAIFGTVLLVFSLPLIQVSKYLWTETLFILFFILFYINLENFIKSQRYSYLTLAGIFAALACVDRYAGVTVVLTAAIFLLFQRKSLAVKVRDIFIFGIISCIPLAAWVIRNWLVSATLLGVRIPSTYGLALNIKRSIQSVYTWIMPDTVLSGVIPASIIKVLMLFTAILPAIIIMALILWYFYIVINKKSFIMNENRASEFVSRDYAIIFMVVFSSIYIVYLLASATKVLFEPINSRYLIPVYIPGIVIILCALDLLTEKFTWQLKAFTRKSMIILLGLFLIYPALNTVAAVAGYAANGAGGYSTKVLHENELIAYVRQNSKACTYYSNNADVVSALTGIRTFYPPKRQGPYMYGLEQFEKAVENDKCPVFIWFRSGAASSLYDIDDIGKLYKLETVEQFESGTVYEIVK